MLYSHDFDRGPNSVNASVNIHVQATFSCYMSDMHFTKLLLIATPVDNIINSKITLSSSSVNETTKRYSISFHIQHANMHIINHGLIACQRFYNNVAKFLLTSLNNPALLLIQGMRALRNIHISYHVILQL